jgi:hypothetical protein
MKPNNFTLKLLLVLLVCTSCNTLYQTKVIHLEVLEPAGAVLPKYYDKIAIRYNNCNVAPNPHLNCSFKLGKTIYDNNNLDSIASKVYFDVFKTELEANGCFDSITEIQAKDYTNIKVLDTINHSHNIKLAPQDSSFLHDELNVYAFSKTLKQYAFDTVAYRHTQYLHPKLGLYTANELDAIADSTNADLLISFDYFLSLDGVHYDKKSCEAGEVVLTMGHWNFYDLNSKKFHYSVAKHDTVRWDAMSVYPRSAIKMLPPRKEAILNAADIAATSFAKYISPTWIDVQRMYYVSNHIELKASKQYIKEENWDAAAKLWKKNVNNPNKSISAKCKFNMALYCEMQGNLTAALEWAVESFYVLKQKNEEHYANCMQYIKILSQRIPDIQVIEKQLGIEN